MTSLRIGLGITSLGMISLGKTSLGIQAFVGIPTLAQLLNAVRIASGHRDFTELLGVLHILGDSCRLASMGVGSTILHGRFTAGFCRTVVASICHRRWGGVDGIEDYEAWCANLLQSLSKSVIRTLGSVHLDRALGRHGFRQFVHGGLIEMTLVPIDCNIFYAKPAVVIGYADGAISSKMH
jgi:hypothetical protein